jgi:hypothetical protein
MNGLNTTLFQLGIELAKVTQKSKGRKMRSVVDFDRAGVDFSLANARSLRFE